MTDPVDATAEQLHTEQLDLIVERGGGQSPLTIRFPSEVPPMPGPEGSRALLAMITRAYEQRQRSAPTRTFDRDACNICGIDHGGNCQGHLWLDPEHKVVAPCAAMVGECSSHASGDRTGRDAWSPQRVVANKRRLSIEAQALRKARQRIRQRARDDRAAELARYEVRHPPGLDRDAHCLDLHTRRRGTAWTYEEIGAFYGVSRNRALQMAQKAEKRWQIPPRPSTPVEALALGAWFAFGGAQAFDRFANLAPASQSTR